MTALLFFPLAELPPLLSMLVSQTQSWPQLYQPWWFLALQLPATSWSWPHSWPDIDANVPCIAGFRFFFLITQLITLSYKSYWIKCYTDIKHIYWPEWLDISAADLFICSCWRTQVSHCTTDFLKQELSFRWKLTVHTNCHTACYWPCARWTKQQPHLPKGPLRQGTAIFSLVPILKNTVLNVENISLSIERKINAIPKINAILSIPKCAPRTYDYNRHLFYLTQSKHH